MKSLGSNMAFKIYSKTQHESFLKLGAKKTTAFWLILSQCTFSLSPENIRKPLSLMLSGGRDKWCIGNEGRVNGFYNNPITYCSATFQAKRAQPVLKQFLYLKILCNKIKMYRYNAAIILLLKTSQNNK